jgi:hypothetical protein
MKKLLSISLLTLMFLFSFVSALDISGYAGETHYFNTTIGDKTIQISIHIPEDAIPSNYSVNISVFEDENGTISLNSTDNALVINFTEVQVGGLIPTTPASHSGGGGGMSYFNTSRLIIAKEMPKSLENNTDINASEENVAEVQYDKLINFNYTSAIIVLILVSVIGGWYFAWKFLFNPNKKRVED